MAKVEFAGLELIEENDSKLACGAIGNGTDVLLVRQGHIVLRLTPDQGKELARQLLWVANEISPEKAK